MIASAIYEGMVQHRRLAPVDHSFDYGMAQLYLDLDELPALCRRLHLLSDRPIAPLWFRRKDYLPATTASLSEAVRREVERQTGLWLDGPVRLLTHVRTFGHVFNPVSFYYCFDASASLRVILAEITNTPWKERHCYAVMRDASPRDDRLQAEFQKEFHVSPFMDMDFLYRWSFTEPAEQLAVRMENRRGNDRAFVASLHLERRALDDRGLARVLLRHPLTTARVVVAIHWQAFQLWRKKVPFHSHPSKSNGLGAAPDAGRPS